MTQELSYFAAGSFVLLSYHLFLWYQLRHQPLATTIGRSHIMRARWVEIIMADRKDILAVQTMRNWTMSASLLASTAIVIGLGILNVMLSYEKSLNMPPQLNLVIQDIHFLWFIKLLLLAADFFFAFFNFTLTIRQYNHAGFLINLPTSPDNSPQIVAKVLNRGANHYTLGMRCYYFAIPLTLWMLGELWFLVGCLFLVLGLLKIDRNEDS